MAKSYYAFARWRMPGAAQPNLKRLGFFTPWETAFPGLWSTLSPSEDQLEQGDDHDQADYENDTYGAAKKFQHNDALIGWA